MFTIGKYTLESLTNGMYSSPLDMYREYIQNAVDSIDDAVSKGLVGKTNSRIDISINTEASTISIKDNGCGINSDNAERLLIDIGNSKKNRSQSRGFRGIGRLAGLGYCDELSFITTAYGEKEKTTITFNAAKLRSMLVCHENKSESIYDVISAVVSTKKSPEKEKSHYFEVLLNGVSSKNDLTNPNIVTHYLVQNVPLPFHSDFKWGRTILSKISIKGYEVPAYNVFLNYNDVTEQIYKPYRDSVVSDRVKKLKDNIADVKIDLLGDDNNPLAIMWHAVTNFYGTVTDTEIKGLRLRQGNILIGNSTTCSQFFKEDRFNGWVIGEIYVINSGLIPNSRRDNFEQNELYYELSDAIKEKTNTITKELRRLSYVRSLSNDKKKIIQVETIDDINSLCVEDMNYESDVDEYTLMNKGDCDLEAETDFVDKLSILLEKRNKHTKYTAININTKLSIEERKIMERIFDIICDIYNEEEANDFINIIAKKY